MIYTLIPILIAVGLPLAIHYYLTQRRQRRFNELRALSEQIRALNYTRGVDPYLPPSDPAYAMFLNGVPTGYGTGGPSAALPINEPIYELEARGRSIEDLEQMGVAWFTETDFKDYDDDPTPTERTVLESQSITDIDRYLQEEINKLEEPTQGGQNARNQ